MFLLRPLFVSKNGAFIAPRWGQVLLAFGMLGIIGWLIVTSFASVTAHELDRRQILSEEGDANAVVFVQRESFTVLLDVERWREGDLSGREVQISRALLGQRLSVVTLNGKATYELAGEEYREPLEVLDGYLAELPEVGDNLDDRDAVYQEMQPTLEEFATEVRQLSATFAELTRAQVQQSLQDRANAEFLQGVLQAVALTIGGALLLWVSFDITSAYRESSRRLAEERQLLDWTRKRLILTQQLDDRGRQWTDAVTEGITAELIFESLAADLDDVLPGLRVEINASPNAEAPVSLVQEPDSPLGDDDYAALLARASSIVRSVVARDERARELLFQQEFDALTKLPNRTGFTREVDAIFERTLGVDGVCSVLVIDIDRFRELNSSLGFATGDALLLQVAERLKATLRDGEFLARLFANEFGVVGLYTTENEAIERAFELRGALDFTTRLSGVDSQVSASMGVAVCDGNNNTAADLMKSASMAIYLATERDERGAFVQYDREKHAAMMSVWREEMAVRDALRAGEFILHFQPIMSLSNNLPVGVEALVRWERPEHGLVYPDQFLPVVNRAGMSVDLGWEIIALAFQCWSRTLANATAHLGLPPLYVSINLEAAQLEDPSLADYIITTAERNGVPATSVVLEVTEHALANSELAIAQLVRLREHGMRVALDDFGTGYSNLGQASMLPLDILKIDRSFMPDGADDLKNVNLVADIGRMAGTLGLIVTAEGVETEEVAATLAEVGIEAAQGYHYSRALYETDLRSWLETRLEPHAAFRV